MSEDEAVRRVLDGVYGVPTLPDTFTIKDPPKDVSESSRFRYVGYLYLCVV